MKFDDSVQTTYLRNIELTFMQTATYQKAEIWIWNEDENSPYYKMRGFELIKPVDLSYWDYCISGGDILTAPRNPGRYVR